VHKLLEKRVAKNQRAVMFVSKNVLAIFPKSAIS
jgi:hypothetical protein